MRDDESDEADDTRDRDAGGGNDAREREQEQFGAFDLDAEVVSVLLAEQEDVQVPSERTQNEDADQRDRERERHVAPLAVVETSHHPEDGFSQRVAAVDEHVGNHRTEERLDRDAGEQQRRDRRSSPVSRDRVDQKRRRERADECREVKPAERNQRRKRDGGDRPRGGTGGDADDRRIGQRVSEEPLHHGSRGGECEPDRRRERDAGQPNVRDDDLARRRNVERKDRGVLEPGDRHGEAEEGHRALPTVTPAGTTIAFSIAIATVTRSILTGPRAALVRETTTSRTTNPADHAAVRTGRYIWQPNLQWANIC